MTSDRIIGRNPVLEALKAGTPIEKIVVLFGTKGAAIDRIRELARKMHIPLAEAGRQKFAEMAGDAVAQGVVAIPESKSYSDVGDILASAQRRGEKPFVLILDGIEDPQNLGALIRTAECAGVHGVVIPKHHAAAVTATVRKASAGASEHMAVAKVTNIAATMDELKNAGLWIVGTEMNGDRLYDGLDYTMACAVVVGNEGSGMRRLVREKCDFLVRIPMAGRIGSLNASVAGALVMYEVLRNRQKSLHEKRGGETLNPNI